MITTRHNGQHHTCKRCVAASSSSCRSRWGQQQPSAAAAPPARCHPRRCSRHRTLTSPHALPAAAWRAVRPSSFPDIFAAAASTCSCRITMTVSCRKRSSHRQQQLGRLNIARARSVVQPPPAVVVAAALLRQLAVHFRCRVFVFLCLKELAVERGGGRRRRRREQRCGNFLQLPPGKLDVSDQFSYSN